MVGDELSGERLDELLKKGPEGAARVIQERIDVLTRKEREQSKPRHELIKSAIFEVLDTNYSTQVCRGDNDIIGPGYSSWMTGVIPVLNLRVKPIDPKFPIQELKLEFRGISHVQNGDLIRTYVPKYNVRNGERTGFVYDGDEYELLYFERDFKEKESVSRIEELDKQNLEVLAVFDGLSIQDKAEY